MEKPIRVWLCDDQPNYLPDILLGSETEHGVGPHSERIRRALQSGKAPEYFEEKMPDGRPIRFLIFQRAGEFEQVLEFTPLYELPDVVCMDYSLGGPSEPKGSMLILSLRQKGWQGKALSISSAGVYPFTNDGVSMDGEMSSCRDLCV